MEKTDSGISVLHWNINGNSSEGMADIRNLILSESVSHIVSKSSPVVIFVCEPQHVNPAKNPLGISKTYEYHGKKHEAGIIWDTTQAKFVPFHEDIVPILIKGRIQGGILTLTKSSQSLIVVSFHGLHKKKDSEKLERIKSLEEFCEKQSQEHGLACIIGGDFNYEMAALPLDKGWTKVIHDGHRQKIQKAESELEKEKKIIDYFLLYQPNGNIQFSNQQCHIPLVFGAHYNDKMNKNLFSKEKFKELQDLLQKFDKETAKLKDWFKSFEDGWNEWTPCYAALDHDPLLLKISITGSIQKESKSPKQEKLSDDKIHTRSSDKK